MYSLFNGLPLHVDSTSQLNPLLESHKTLSLTGDSIYRAPPPSRDSPYRFPSPIETLSTGFPTSIRLSIHGYSTHTRLSQQIPQPTRDSYYRLPNSHETTTTGLSYPEDNHATKNANSMNLHTLSGKL